MISKPTILWVICSLFILGLLSACKQNDSLLTPTILSTPTRTETLQPTETNTPLPTVTDTPQPTVTPTLVPTVFSGYKEDRLIAFNCGDKDVCVSSLEGNNEKNLTEDLSSDTKKALVYGWSPDSNWLLIVVRENDSGWLWITRPDGKDKKQIIPLKNWININWSNDSSRFVYNCTDSELATNGINSEELCLFTLADFSIEKTGFFGDTPQFSPDGLSIAWMNIQGDKFSKIIFTLKSIKIGGNQPEEVLVLPDRGGNQEVVGNFLWTPNGQQFFYAIGNELFSIKVDGTENEMILALEREISLYKGGFSPDGHYLRFGYGMLPPQQSAILNLSTKKVVIYDALYAFWTPDNQLILCLINPDGITKDYYLMDPNSGTKEKLFDFGWLNAKIQP